MEKKFLFAIILFFLIVIHFISVSGQNSAYAQEVKKTSSNDPNESDLKKALEKRFEAERLKRLKYLQEHPEEVTKPPVFDLNEADLEKASAKEIEASNIRYKDRIFGNTFHDMAISIEPTKDEYEIGDEIEILCLFKNFSKKKQNLEFISDSTLFDYRYALYFYSGSPIQKSDYYKKIEDNIGKTSSTISERGTQLRSQEIFSYLLKINQIFKIEKEGTYFLVIMRRIKNSWEAGFMISNMTKINIVKKKD
jgi:hypothetical protein